MKKTDHDPRKPAGFTLTELAAMVFMGALTTVGIKVTMVRMDHAVSALLPYRAFPAPITASPSPSSPVEHAGFQTA
ncbi:MAG TPA: hypothetical protein VGK14_01020 [Novimethylophilus sp.]|jgi:hypothetical protein|uniref:hypothetical protein n=1 Tax=Novimethylophilus sp. TaxID=2137426 RepID=UPI002F3EEBE2